jgi:hypothetical protein
MAPMIQRIAPERENHLQSLVRALRNIETANQSRAIEQRKTRFVNRKRNRLLRAGISSIAFIGEKVATSNISGERRVFQRPSQLDG